MTGDNGQINRVSLFLDSGAFSAWTQGTEVNIDDYAEFALENLDRVEAIANLDVIPGKPFQRLTDQHIEDSAARGWENYEYLISKGIPKDKLLHIFHQGEDFSWLEKMVKTMPYIGLSPGNDKSTDEKVMWLDECMKYVCDKDGMPKVKFHGFAVTAHRLLLRYPWYSVDSTTWVIHGRLGAIMVPKNRGGEWIYDESPLIIPVSERSPNKSDAGAHINSMSPRHRQMILDYIALKGYALGESSYKMVPQNHVLEKNEIWGEKKPKDKDALRKVTVIEKEGVSNRYTLRDEMNIIYFQDLEQHLPKWPWAFKQKTIPRLI